MNEKETKDSVNVGLIHRLFDQLEKGMGKVDDGMASLSQAIAEMLDILKHSTSNDEVVAVINRHSDSVKPSADLASKIFDKCNAHGKDVESINTFLSKLSMWVRTMIIVVLVTFSLLTISYYFTRSSIENMVKQEFHSAEIQDSTTKQDYLELKKQLFEIREELIKRKGGNEKTLEK
jgi:hypothetical protein